MSFDGFPAATSRFLQDLSANNNRDWFNDNKTRYQQDVLAPAFEFIETAGPLLAKISPDVRYSTATNGSGSLFRIHRDVRFSKDKSPYKTNLGIFFWLDAAPKKGMNPGYYFHMDANGGLLYTGMKGFTPANLQAYREAVDNEQKGQALEKILKNLANKGIATGGEHYKRVPRGYDKDHPRANLLKHNTVFARSDLNPETIGSAQLIETLLQHAKDSKALGEWIADIVRASSE